MNAALYLWRDAGPGVRPWERRAPARPFLRLAVALVLLAFPLHLARAAEVIPPAPERHFNDYAKVVRPDTARELDARLAAFERETSNQVVVALYPRMQSGSSVEDYTVRVAQAWGVGRKDRKNGAVLFAFMEQRQLYLQVGYGLEGAIPDALAKRIIEDEIVPRFRAGDRDAGLRAGVDAILAATRGEYRGTGRTVGEQPGDGRRRGPLFFVVLLVIVIAITRSSHGGNVYSPRGRRGVWTNSGPWGGGGFGGFGGGGRSGGGGGFSGGGGSFGGGGAGGRW